MIRQIVVTDAEFEKLRDLIYRHTGIAVKDSKRSMLKARLGKRLQALAVSTLGEYCRVIEKSDPHGEELRRMINCVTTNKTSFFREPAHFDALKEWALARNGPLSIWSAACSTGEEPYSIAMTLAPPGTLGVRYPHRIVASDIDTEVLDHARTGIYPESAMAEISLEMRKRFFLRGTGTWAGLSQVKEELRNAIEFRRINLNEDARPLPGSFDVIFCRNVAIYFDRDTQRKVFTRLTSMLHRSGLLFVGHSESLFWMNDVLESVGQGIYRPAFHGANIWQKQKFSLSTTPR